MKLQEGECVHQGPHLAGVLDYNRSLASFTIYDVTKPILTMYPTFRCLDTIFRYMHFYLNDITLQVI